MLGQVGAQLGPSGAKLGQDAAKLAQIGALMGASWGQVWAMLEQSWAKLGPSCLQNATQEGIQSNLVQKLTRWPNIDTKFDNFGLILKAPDVGNLQVYIYILYIRPKSESSQEKWPQEPILARFCTQVGPC